MLSENANEAGMVYAVGKGCCGCLLESLSLEVGLINKGEENAVLNIESPDGKSLLLSGNLEWGCGEGEEDEYRSDLEL